jgi:hypothetical protein
MVTFVLPTTEENDWVRTGRGFDAVRWYKEHKKGIGKMMNVQVQVRDYDAIEGFLQALINKVGDSKVDAIFGLESLVNTAHGCDEKRITLENLKTSFRNNVPMHVRLSGWLEHAEAGGLYPLPGSKDKTDKEAIADAVGPPKEKTIC